MKARGLRGALAIGLVVVLTIPASAAAGGGQARLTLSQFELEDPNGYKIEAGAMQRGATPRTAAIRARRGGLSASYEVPTGPGPGVHARFGTVGNVALDFHRRKRVVEKPAKGCVWITETGVFRGSFSFAGEGDYAAAEAKALRGQVLTLPNGFCGVPDDRRKRSPLPSLLRTNRLAARAPTPHGSLKFEATVWPLQSTTGFSAEARERLGTMEIIRTASAGVDGIAFSAPGGKAPREVSVQPPAPFRGSADYLDPPSGPSTWTGSLEVTLLGLDALPLAGPSFSSQICLGISIVDTCRVQPATL
jgi:hypothetical protein